MTYMKTSFLNLTIFELAIISNGFCPADLQIGIDTNYSNLNGQLSLGFENLFILIRYLMSIYNLITDDNSIVTIFTNSFKE